MPSGIFSVIPAYYVPTSMIHPSMLNDNGRNRVKVGMEDSWWDNVIIQVIRCGT